MKTPSPLKIGKLTWGVEGSISNTDVRDSSEPGMSAFFSNVFNDGKAGIHLAATYEERDRRIDKVQTGDPNWRAASSSDPALDGGFFPERLRLEQRRGELPKFNLSANFEIQPSDELKLFIKGVITREQRNEDKSRIQVEFRRGRFQGGTIDPATGTLVAAGFDRQRVDYNNFRRETDLDTNGVSAGLEWKPGNWEFKFKTSYSDSEEDFNEYVA